jgi:hypothetical protein
MQLNSIQRELLKLIRLAQTSRNVLQCAGLVESKKLAFYEILPYRNHRFVFPFQIYMPHIAQNKSSLPLNTANREGMMERYEASDFRALVSFPKAPPVSTTLTTSPWAAT